MDKVFNEEELLADTIEGIQTYDYRITNKRAKELAKLNMEYVADMMQEAQAMAICRICQREEMKRKGVV